MFNKTQNIKEYILEDYELGMPLKEICNKYKICNQTIGNLVNSAGLTRSRRSKRKYDYDSIVSLYIKGKTCREIAVVVNGNYRRISAIVKNKGVSRPREMRVGFVRARVKKCLEFDNKFVSFMDGLVISDGSLFCAGRSPTANYQQYSVKREWLSSIARVLKNKKIESIIYEDKREDRNICYALRTPVYERLYEQFLRWYRDGNKIVPEDLNLEDKNFLKNWIYGDGTLVGTNLRLCTDSFLEKEIDWLILSFKKSLDLKFKKVYMGLSKKGSPKFRLSLCLRDGLSEFYNYLGSPLDYFDYKWRFK